ncbi:hypothetical protein SRHO_G00186910 [Serrasalmus rhombeus]
MFYFLWGSKWERLRRDVIKKRKENGGKGLPDPYLFLTSKFVALHIQYATTPPRDNKTEAMAKFWTGSYLRRPGGGEAKQVWKNAAHPALQNRLKDLAWMAAYEVLPVQAVMHSRGMAKNPACPRPGCGQPETVRHVFWECSVARDLWALTGPLQCPSLLAGVVHPRFYRLAANGVGQSISKLLAGEFTSLWLTLMSVTSALWTARNLLLGKGVMVPLHAILRLATCSRQGASRVSSDFRDQDEGFPTRTDLEDGHSPLLDLTMEQGPCSTPGFLGSVPWMVNFQWKDTESGDTFPDHVPFIQEVLFGALGLGIQDLICA